MLFKRSLKWELHCRVVFSQDPTGLEFGYITCKGRLLVCNIIITRMPIQYISVRLNMKAVVCYIGSWAVYEEGDYKFSWDKFDPSICTHAIYCFADIDKDTCSLKTLGGYFE